MLITCNGWAKQTGGTPSSSPRLCAASLRLIKTQLGEECVAVRDSCAGEREAAGNRIPCAEWEWTGMGGGGGRRNWRAIRRAGRCGTSGGYGASIARLSEYTHMDAESVARTVLKCAAGAKCPAKILTAGFIIIRARTDHFENFAHHHNFFRTLN